MGGRTNGAILADSCEAIIGALYLDGGLPAAEKFIRDRWAERIDRTGGPPQDVKTALQEWAQGRGKPLPIYEVLGQTGPDHSPKFEVKVHVEGHDDGDRRRQLETGGRKSCGQRHAAPRWSTDQ